MAKKTVKKTAKQSSGAARGSTRTAAKQPAKPATASGKKTPAAKAATKTAKAAPKTAKPASRRAATAAVVPPKVAAKKPASPAAGRLPAVGSKAPTFSLPASDGSTVSLAGFRGRRVVVFFYPKADTPGCTKEACGFNARLAAFADRDVAVVGISPDPLKAVTKFSGKFSLGFPLLADADHQVCEAYGVWVEKSMYGRTYMGVARTTFIIDPDGTIAHVFEQVTPAGHEAEVLAWLEAGG